MIANTNTILSLFINVTILLVIFPYSAHSSLISFYSCISILYSCSFLICICASLFYQSFTCTSTAGSIYFYTQLIQRTLLYQLSLWKFGILLSSIPLFGALIPCTFYLLLYLYIILSLALAFIIFICASFLCIAEGSFILIFNYSANRRTHPKYVIFSKISTSLTQLLVTINMPS
jgi:hypothetical protein